MKKHAQPDVIIVGSMNSTDSITITSVDSITLEVADPEAAARFYADAFGLGGQVRMQASESATSKVIESMDVIVL